MTPATRALRRCAGVISDRWGGRVSHGLSPFVLNLYLIQLLCGSWKGWLRVLSEELEDFEIAHFFVK